MLQLFYFKKKITKIRFVDGCGVPVASTRWRYSLPPTAHAHNWRYENVNNMAASVQRLMCAGRNLNYRQLLKTSSSRKVGTLKRHASEPKCPVVAGSKRRGSLREPIDCECVPRLQHGQGV